jgi:uncharacterized membrane protein (DUF4010 family)
MTGSPVALPEAVRGIAEALLIGFLVGAQREASHGERHAGVRDFVLIALVGGLSGLLDHPWLTVAALAAITALLGVYYVRNPERTGITTEMAAVATFCLGYLTTTPASPLGAPLAIGIAIAVVSFLEAKRSLHKLVRETITEAEFNDTLRFLATIFIIYPILPEGSYGPFDFFAPRKIWLFVILVSSVSYLGYFFQKFLGVSRGLTFAGLFGGLASTTAATLAFARSAADEPAKRSLYAQAAVIANAMQFPRVLLLLLVVSPALASAAALPLVIMAVSGLLLGFAMTRVSTPADETGGMAAANPFRLRPALKFGAVFTVILFASDAASELFGSGGLYWTSVIGGTLDADAVVVSVTDVMARGQIGIPGGMLAVGLALLANAALKSAIALYAGTPAFGLRIMAGFAAMFGAGAITLALSN